MFKKIKKLIKKEFVKRYEQLEEHYLGFENRFYTTLEERLTTLEDKFDEISDLLKEEIRQRKERTQAKQAEDGTGEVADDEANEEEAAANANSDDDTEKEEKEEEVDLQDLTLLKGLGKKLSQRLQEQDVTSIKQIAEMTKEEIQQMDEKVKSFAARYERYDWGTQAQELL